MQDFKIIVKEKSTDELKKMIFDSINWSNEINVWSKEMIMAVEDELIERNAFPTDYEDKRKKMIEEERIILEAGKNASTIGLIIGWICVLGFIGTYLGYQYAFSKVSSKFTSDVYYVYNDTSRKNGSYLFYTSIVLIIISLYLKFSN